MVMKLLFQKKLDAESTVKVDMDLHCFFLKFTCFPTAKSLTESVFSGINNNDFTDMRQEEEKK